MASLHAFYRLSGGHANTTTTRDSLKQAPSRARQCWSLAQHRLLRLSAAVAAHQQQPQQAPTAADKAQVAQVLDLAQQLEYSGQQDEALELLRQSLEELEVRQGWGRGARMLRQRACHLRFTAGDYGGALHEARAVHDEMCREAGEGSGEAVLFGLRRGILEAASGELEMGRHLIYRTGAWVAPQLQRMVQQQQDEGGQGAAALPDVAIRRLSETLNECNFFGSVFTIKHLAHQGKAHQVLEKWESLDAGVVQCFTYLLLALAPGAHPVQNALREHNRLVEELGGHPLLGERLQQQSAQLRQAVGNAARVRSG